MAEGSAASTEASVATLEGQFAKFCNFGNHGKAAKKALTDKNLTKMFKDCKLYGKALTTADTDIAFNKVKTKGSRYVHSRSNRLLIIEKGFRSAPDRVSLAFQCDDLLV